MSEKEKGMFKDQRQIFDMLQNESHRGAVLVGAELINDYLFKLLKGFMIDDANQEVKKLLKNGPLRNFSARSRSAYCLGLISKDEFDDIELIRDIRNKFAHKLLEATFDNPEIQERCHKLKTLNSVPFLKYSDEPSRFFVAVVSISSNIALRTLGIHKQRREKAKPFQLAEYIGSESINSDES